MWQHLVESGTAPSKECDLRSVRRKAQLPWRSDASSRPGDEAVRPENSVLEIFGVPR